jgi:hypothetical protein
MDVKVPAIMPVLAVPVVVQAAVMAVQAVVQTHALKDVMVV